MYEPYAIKESITLTRDEIIEGSYQIKDGFLPAKITVGEKTIGPADWLRGALDVLCGEDTVTVAPSPWQIDLDQFQRVKNCTYKGWVHSPELKDEYLSARYKLQSWTVRFDRGTPRKVFD